MQVQNRRRAYLITVVLYGGRKLLQKNTAIFHPAKSLLKSGNLSKYAPQKTARKIGNRAAPR